MLILYLGMAIHEFLIHTQKQENKIKLLLFLVTHPTIQNSKSVLKTGYKDFNRPNHKSV